MWSMRGGCSGSRQRSRDDAMIHSRTELAAVSGCTLCRRDHDTPRRRPDVDATPQNDEAVVKKISNPHTLTQTRTACNCLYSAKEPRARLHLQGGCNLYDIRARTWPLCEPNATIATIQLKRTARNGFESNTEKLLALSHATQRAT